MMIDGGGLRKEAYQKNAGIITFHPPVTHFSHASGVLSNPERA